MQETDGTGGTRIRWTRILADGRQIFGQNDRQSLYFGLLAPFCSHSSMMTPTAKTKARWTPPDALVEGIKLLFESALGFNHQRIKDLGQHTSKKKVQDLKDYLGIGNAEYSGWSTGQSKIDRIPLTTMKLLQLFTGETYIKRDDPDQQSADREFAKGLHGFWSKTDPEVLKNVAELLQRHDVTIRALKKQDGKARVERRLEDLASQARLSAGNHGGSENFILDPTPTTLPPRLRPHSPIKYRDNVVDSLKALFERWHKHGCVVQLVGPESSGKSAVLRSFTTALASQNPREPPIAVLSVSLSDAPLPRRAFYRSLVGARSAVQGTMFSREDAAGGEDEEEREAFPSDFITSYLSSRLGGRALVAFLEDYSDIAGDESLVRELRTVVDSRAFRGAFTLLETRGENLQTTALNTKVGLEPFSPEQAVDLLVEAGQPHERAMEAIRILGSDYRLLHPGILLQGAVRCDPHIQLAENEPTAEELAFAIMERASIIAQDVLGKLCAASDCDSRGAMLTLAAMSVFSKAPITSETLSTADLAPIPRQGLVRLGWLEPEGTSLAGFGHHCLRATAALVFSGRETGDLGLSRPALRDAVDRLVTVLFDDLHSYTVSALEESVTWLKRHVPGETDLITHLEALLLQEAVADPVSPLTDEEQRAAAPTFLKEASEKSDLDLALAALALSVGETESGRVEAGARTRENFLKSLNTISELLISDSELNIRQLSALDIAMYLGARQFHLYSEVLVARKAIFDAVGGQETTAVAEDNLLWLSSWVSFLINIADLSISVGDRAQARRFIERVRAILGDASTYPDTPWKYRLLARFALLRERVAEHSSEQREALREATHNAGRCLQLAPQDPRWVRYYLRTVRRLVDAEGEERARKQCVDSARTLLESVLGPADAWQVAYRAQYAALMRQEARRSWNLQYQSDRANEALWLLLATQPAGKAQVDDDPAACLVRARLQSFLGDHKGALASCDKSIKLVPTPAAWLLKLRLLDGIAGGQEDWFGDFNLGSSQFGPISQRLRDAITTFRKWMDSNPDGSSAYGAVELWIAQRRWRAVGSIERQIIADLDSKNIDYARLPKEEKLKHLRKEFQTRQNQLRSLAKRFGTTIALSLAEFRNTAQYVRSTSVVSGTPPDVEKALGAIDKALQRWPGSHILLFWRAEYFRYIWQMEKAIDGFRVVWTTATDGDLRRRAAVCLVRSLHTAAVYGEDDDEEKRTQYLGEAKRVVTELAGSFHEAEDISILRDHIALEAGDNVDWSSLEEVYDKIVGKIDGFPTTLIRNFDQVKSARTRAPTDISQALERNFADPETLGLAGLLYLRRAEKGIGNRRDDDFACAIAFLRAQALLERSWLGQELPTTSFRIGRTIVSAAEAVHSLNPVDGLDTDGKPDQLALAESKFSSVVSRTSGAFRRKAQEQQSHAAKLRASLLHVRS